MTGEAREVGEERARKKRGMKGVEEDCEKGMREIRTRGVEEDEME